MSKWVYSFGAGRNEGRATMASLLGGKGANLAEMSTIGLPVPPGFTITTEVCTLFGRDGAYPPGVAAQVDAALRGVETETGRRFGDAADPLLLSVRAGARVSMPGMMDTVLNLGLNDETVAGLARSSGDPRFAWDSYRRLVSQYGAVVLGVDAYRFEEVIDTVKLDRGGLVDEGALDAAAWRTVVAEFKALIAAETGHPFPTTPRDQLWGAMAAMFASWNNPRANTYRRLHDIPADWGTAVNVQAMVFGNRGADSATGVCFTRDPSTGENVFWGEYLPGAQGDDLVAGHRTPKPLTIAQNVDGNAPAASASGLAASGLPGPVADAVPMETAMPDAFAALLGVRTVLEQHYRDVQDVEFTVENGVLHLLQTRAAKRSAAASLRIAVEMAGEGLITRADAIARVSASSLDQLLHPALDPHAPRRVLARGLPASPGAASGVVVFDSESAEAAAGRGEQVILVRLETSPEDIHGMHAASGVLTTRGGMTSHAAVVARGMGRPCVTGAGALAIDPIGRTVSSNGITVGGGEVITIDGATGEVFAGAVPTIEPTLTADFATLMTWADAVRRLRIRANAETPADATTARRFGAEGIGLCRTEHMFFDPDRIGAVREMIMASDDAGRRVALERLLPLQRADFAALFRIMAPLPVTVRLLDPPLHEFLPRSEREIAAVARALGVGADAVRRRQVELGEANPMLGHRGCRVGISYPEIYAMQARAIFEGLADVLADGGETVALEIMIPLVGTRRELAITREAVEAVGAAVSAARGLALPVAIGTMIELPRAALVADEIAGISDFFSFGTNDLTQTVFGFSRDDAGKFLPNYVASGIVPADPFVSIDVDGVGALVRLAAEKGRRANPGITLGICGEHGGDPASITFCERLGLDYVSCSPYRIPIARLAAAQAALLEEADLTV